MVLDDGVLTPLNHMYNIMKVHEARKYHKLVPTIIYTYMYISILLPRTHVQGVK